MGDTPISISRRAWIAGAGGAGLAAAGTGFYYNPPPFWRAIAGGWGRDIAPPPASPGIAVWGDRGLHVAWLGHATLLLKIDGFTILTDPVFSDRAGLNFGPVTVGIKRLIAPALRLPDLPPIDLVLLSHAHMDHWDIPSLVQLESRKTEVVTAWSTSDLLRASRYRRVRELRWGERAQAGAAEIRAIEVNHWGARMRTDRWRGYNGYLIESGRWRVLFAGDTADTDAFRAVRTRRGIDLAIMPIGAYNPWIRYHCTPEQAWRMGNDAGAGRFIPVHHQTFSLGREPRLEPIERFRAAAGRQQDRIALDRIGHELRLG